MVQVESSPLKRFVGVEIKLLVSFRLQLAVSLLFIPAAWQSVYVWGILQLPSAHLSDLKLPDACLDMKYMQTHSAGAAASGRSSGARNQPEH